MPRDPSDYDLPGYDAWKTDDERPRTPPRFRDTSDDDVPDDAEQWKRESEFEREVDDDD